MEGIEVHKKNNMITVSLADAGGNEDPIITEIREIVRRKGKNGIGLAPLGQEIRKTHKNFNVKLYGYSQLYRFIDSIPGLKVKGSAADRRVYAET